MVDSQKIIIIKNENDEKIKLKMCPFPYQERRDPDTDEITQRKEHHPCGVRNKKGNPVGKGSWCRNCTHYLQSKITQKKHEKHMQELLNQRKNSEKYGGRIKGLNEFWEGNKKSVSDSIDFINDLSSKRVLKGSLLKHQVRKVC